MIPGRCSRTIFHTGSFQWCWYSPQSTNAYSKSAKLALFCWLWEGFCRLGRLQGCSSSRGQKAVMISLQQLFADWVWIFLYGANTLKTFIEVYYLQPRSQGFFLLDINVKREEAVGTRLIILNNLSIAVSGYQIHGSLLWTVSKIKATEESAGSIILRYIGLFYWRNQSIASSLTKHTPS